MKKIFLFFVLNIGVVICSASPFDSLYVKIKGPIFFDQNTVADFKLYKLRISPAFIDKYFVDSTGLQCLKIINSENVLAIPIAQIIDAKTKHLILITLMSTKTN